MSQKIGIKTFGEYYALRISMQALQINYNRNYQNSLYANVKILKLAD
jgi:hypothetical protein